MGSPRKTTTTPSPRRRTQERHGRTTATTRSRRRSTYSTNATATNSTSATEYAAGAASATGSATPNSTGCASTTGAADPVYDHGEWATGSVCGSSATSTTTTTPSLSHVATGKWRPTNYSKFESTTSKRNDIPPSASTTVLSVSSAVRNSLRMMKMVLILL